MKKSIFVSGFLAVLGACLSGCLVWSVKTSQVHENLARTKSQIEDNRLKVENDYALKSEAINYLGSLKANDDQKPYPQARGILEEMARAKTGIEESFSVYRDHEDDLQGAIKGKGTLKSNDPEWSRFARARKNFPKMIKELETRFDIYSEASKRLETLMNDYRIVRIRMNDLTGKVQPMLSAFDQNLVTTKIQLEEAASRLAAMVPGEARRRYEEAISKLNLLLLDIESQRSQFEDQLTRLREEGGNRQEVWSGPGTAAGGIVGDMEALSQKIDLLIVNFHQTAREASSTKK